MRNILRFLPLCLLLLSSCATKQYAPLSYGENIPQNLLDTTLYRIQPGDKLKIQSFNNLTSVLYENTMSDRPTTNATVPAFEVWVDSDGKIVLPKVGRLSILGTTEEEAARKIENAYSSIIQSPAFDVKISNLRVKVLGAVYNQGLYFLERENQTLGEVLAMAGGVNFEQLGKKLVLIRGNSAGESKSMEFDLEIKDLANSSLNNIVMHNDDIVYLPPSQATVSASKFRNISGFVQPILLVLNSIILITTLTNNN